MRDTLSPGTFWSKLAANPEGQKCEWEQISKSPGIEVRTYQDLTEEIAFLSFHNPQYNLFLRGQHRDYRLDDGRSSLLPKVYRETNMPELMARLPSYEDALKRWINTNLREANTQQFERTLLFDLGNIRETMWSILQHYFVPTPMLDITQSLRVACSFATTDNLLKRTESHDGGYVYVFGLPYIHGSVSTYAFDGMILIKLTAACPPQAKRPHFQDGYMIGSIPSDDNAQRLRYRNVDQRLIAKYHVPNTAEFWKDTPSAKVPYDLLLPANDIMEQAIQGIEQQLGYR